MIALVQRVLQASVTIAGAVHGAIGRGMLALVCAERGDSAREALFLADKTADFRLFEDDARHMNRSLVDAGHALLAVPQFTLAADTSRGRRASFTPAAPPELARPLFDMFVERSRTRVPCVEVGVFGADMQVALINDGPVTFWLRIPPSQKDSQ